MRFSVDSLLEAHQGWYAALATRYDDLDVFQNPQRVRNAGSFLDGILRTYGSGKDILDVACGTFRIDITLQQRGYRVVGRDLSAAMVAQARRALRSSRLQADVAQGDMRSLNLDRAFDAILCLGTAFNYLVEPADIRAALRTFQKHLQTGGILILDLTNFDAWIRKPSNARIEADRSFADGVRVTIFALNDQDLRRPIHYARFITAMKRGRRLDLRFSEAPLRIWRRNDVAALLRGHNFRILAWWGDLRVGAQYIPGRSPRLVAVAVKK